MLVFDERLAHVRPSRSEAVTTPFSWRFDADRSWSRPLVLLHHQLFTFQNDFGDIFDHARLVVISVLPPWILTGYQRCLQTGKAEMLRRLLPTVTPNPRSNGSTVNRHRCPTSAACDDDAIVHSNPRPHEYAYVVLQICERSTACGLLLCNSASPLPRGATNATETIDNQVFLKVFLMLVSTSSSRRHCRRTLPAWAARRRLSFILGGLGECDCEIVHNHLAAAGSDP